MYKIIFSILLSVLSFNAAADTIQLSWVNPTTRVDGSPITNLDIWYNKIQCGTSPGAYIPALDVTISKGLDGSLASAAQVTLPSDGQTYYCSIFTAGLKGDNSDPSNEIMHGPGLSPISPPGSFTITTTTTTVVAP